MKLFSCLIHEVDGYMNPQYWGCQVETFGPIELMQGGTPSSVYVSSWIDDVEQFLPEDNDEIAENHDFFNDFFSNILLNALSDALYDDAVALNVGILSREGNSTDEEKEKSNFYEEKIVGESDQMTKNRKGTSS